MRRRTWAVAGAVVLVAGTTISGVVLGQPGNDLIDAGLVTAESMVDAIVGDRAAPGAPQPMPAPGALPRVRARQTTGVGATNTERGNP